uniref:Clc-like protein n=1 Tax=Syphacia muris TaxID=451379 RepID=A0A0N5AWE7_9BILA
MGSGRSVLPQTITLVIGLILLLIGVVLSIIAVISPSWQVVDIREYHEEHHHGLWQDCTRAHIHKRIEDYRQEELGHLTSNIDLAPLSCTYKFDRKATDIVQENIYDSSAAIESELHQFYGWQKAVLIGIFVSLVSASIGVIVGTCAPCHSACSVIFVIFIFVALLFSTSALGIFYFAAHRVDSRFVQGHVGTYEVFSLTLNELGLFLIDETQNMGWAFTIYTLSILCYFFSIIVSLVATYQLLRKSDDRISMPVRELAPLYSTHMTSSAI